MEAAKTLFLNAGYDGANLDQIAKASGVSRQTVYNQFGSKEAVFRRVMERHWQTIKADAAFSFAASVGVDPEPRNVLHGFAAAMLRFVTETNQVGFTRLVIAESRRLPWIGEEFYHMGKEPLLKAFSACLAEMTANGLLRCAQPELAAHQFMGLIQEFIIWPQVMAIGPALQTLPGSDTVVEEAIKMFLGRYATSDHRPGDDFSPD